MASSDDFVIGGPPAPPARITSITWRPATDRDNKQAGHVLVKDLELFNGSNPVTGGMYDPKMGTTDFSYLCSTCLCDRLVCPGHPGNYEMVIGVLEPLMLSTTNYWIKIVCRSCGALRVDPEDYAGRPSKTRLRAAAGGAASLPASCAHCKRAIPEVRKSETDNMGYEVKTLKGWVPYYAFQIKAAFSRVSTADVLAMGQATHPQNLVIRMIMVPGVSLRPGLRAVLTVGSTSHNDVTTILQHLIRANKSLAESRIDFRQLATKQIVTLEENVNRDIELIRGLYYDLTLGRSGNSQSKKNKVSMTMRPLRSVLRRIPGKPGRLRKNNLGKRTLSAARTVISSTRRLRVDQLGIPIHVAKQLIIEETVMPWNYDKLIVVFRNGPRWPGCNYVMRKATGMIQEVDPARMDPLNIGDVVHRHLQDDDPLYFNRAPTLERSSVGVHRAVVFSEGETFRVNVLGSTLYNFDFDGDAMSVYQPHTERTRAEATILSPIHNAFISPKTSTPSIGQVQDSVMGMGLLTMRGAFLNEYQAYALFENTQMEPPELPALSAAQLKERGGPYWRGTEVVSAFLMRYAPINYGAKTKWYSEAFGPYLRYYPEEKRVVIRNGEILSGILDKNSLAGAGSIFHVISRELGTRFVLKAIFAIQQIALNYIDLRGFSVNYGDFIVHPSQTGLITDMVSDCLRASSDINGLLLNEDLVPPIDMTHRQYYELEQMNALGIPDATSIEPSLRSMNPDSNGFLQMVLMGGKGKIKNIIHMTTVIGQVTINTRRLPESLGTHRATVYMRRYSLDPVDRGFNPNSYIGSLQALRSRGYYASACGNRSDLISKAIATAIAGYSTRRGVRSLESAISGYSAEVTHGRVAIQYLFGENGIDPRHVDAISFAAVKLPDAEFGELVRLGAGRAESAATRAYRERAEADRQWYRTAFLAIERGDFNHPFIDRVYLPAHVGRLAEKHLGLRGAKKPSKAELGTLDGKIAMVEAFVERLPYVYVNEDLFERREERGAPAIPQYYRDVVRMMGFHTRLSLSAGKLDEMTTDELRLLLSEALRLYEKSLVSSGTAVGIGAVMAVSEPFTQYLLDSHHRSVAGGTSKEGIMRAEEIMLAKMMEAEVSAKMLLFLKDGLGADKERVQKVANSVEFLRFRRFVDGSPDGLYEPLDQCMVPQFREDEKWIADFHRHNIHTSPPNDLTQYCYRVALSRGAMIHKSITLEDIVTALRRDRNIYVIYSPEAAETVVVRVYYRSAAFGKAEESEKKFGELLEALLEQPIRGISGINSAKVVKSLRSGVTAAGALEPEDSWCIETSGSNLSGVGGCDELDWSRCVTSSIWDTFLNLGHEAARMKIVSELRRLLSTGPPCYTQMALYADTMLKTNYPTPINQAGIVLREPTNIMTQMAMGSPIQVLTRALANSERSEVYGVSGPMILGDMPKVGSLYTSLIVNHRVTRDIKTVDSVLDDLFSEA